MNRLEQGENSLNTLLIPADRYLRLLTLCILIEISSWNAFLTSRVTRTIVARFVANRYAAAGCKVATFSVPAANKRLALETISVLVILFPLLYFTMYEMKSGRSLSILVRSRTRLRTMLKMSLAFELETWE